MVYAAQPREGTETPAPVETKALVSAIGLCSSTPRGDGNSPIGRIRTDITTIWFMQLNPARGRKHQARNFIIHHCFFRVYAAQPREGTETYLVFCGGAGTHKPGLCSSTPRGDGNSADIISAITSPHHGLCSSTPRGDGNDEILYMGYGVLVFRFMQLNPARGRKLSVVYLGMRDLDGRVYAAQPREGTETGRL